MVAIVATDAAAGEAITVAAVWSWEAQAPAPVTSRARGSRRSGERAKARAVMTVWS
jgi:hypothetical protein